MINSLRNPKLLQVTGKGWLWPKQRGFSWACCDCGLTHRVDFRVVKVTETLKEQKREVMPKEYQVEIRVLPNNYVTNKVRKKQIEIYEK